MKDPVYHRMFNYPVERLPNSYLAELELGVTTIEEAASRTGATIGYPGWGLIYHIMLSHLDRTRNEVIIETGTNFGCTTIVLAQALIDAGCAGHVVTFELEEANVDRAKANASRAGVASRIKFVQGNSMETMPAQLAGLENVRFAFLDASHLFDDVMREFELLLPVLAPDALVLFDNTYRIAGDGEDQRVNGALQEIQRKFGGNLVNLEFVSWFTPGLAIWQRTPKL